MIELMKSPYDLFSSLKDHSIDTVEDHKGQEWYRLSQVLEFWEIDPASAGVYAARHINAKNLWKTKGNVDPGAPAFYVNMAGIWDFVFSSKSIYSKQIIQEIKVLLVETPLDKVLTIYG